MATPIINHAQNHHFNGCCKPSPNGNSHSSLWQPGFPKLCDVFPTPLGVRKSSLRKAGPPIKKWLEKNSPELRPHLTSPIYPTKIGELKRSKTSTKDDLKYFQNLPNSSNTAPRCPKSNQLKSNVSTTHPTFDLQRLQSRTVTQHSQHTDARLLRDLVAIGGVIKSEIRDGRFQMVKFTFKIGTLW